MLKDIVPFEQVWTKFHNSSFYTKAIVSFIHVLEKKFGAQFVYDQSRFNNEIISLSNLYEIAEKLHVCGIIRSYGMNIKFCDEPGTISWRAEYSLGNGKYEFSGGSSFENTSLAFTKMLAEAIERNTWFTYNKFSPSLTASITEMERGVNFINPNRFAGYKNSVREKNTPLQIKSSNSFRWIQGYSWIKKTPIWIPAQIVSGHKNIRAYSFTSKEPAIRESITNGLATHPVRTCALISGALEVIERDAYMITWLNQLTLPRIDLEELSSKSASLSKILNTCHMYRLNVHAINLLTDAPTYVICIVLEDLSELVPKFSIGLKAHQNATVAVEGALLEALRAHTAVRRWRLSSKDTWNPLTKSSDITHHNRLMYWSEEGRSEKLNFLIQGKICPLKKGIWESDTDEEHFSRITNWCKEKKYELISVNLNDADANIPKWNIEFVVIPELQSIYFNEKQPQTGGDRLQDIPRQFGYKHREPYCDNPHPFA